MLFWLFFAAASLTNPNQYLKDYNNKLPEPFPRNYMMAREEFRSLIKTLPDFAKAEVGAQPITNQRGADITIDHIYLPAPVPTDKLVIVTAGVHGAEAYVGHMVVTDLLKLLQTNRAAYPFNFLIVHSVNPFGFKYFRRTNENNVDLNRNFASIEDFQKENKAYRKLRRFLKPTTQANAMWIAQLQFFWAAAWRSLTNGKKTILAAIGGQYHDPQGIFYGGKNTEQETVYLQFLIRRHIARFNTIYHLDIHTGFGEKGQMHVIAPPEAVKAHKDKFQKMFDGFKLSTGEDKDFYQTTGDITSWTMKNFPNKTVLPVTLEMGTMDSQSLLDGIRSLWIMVVENQGYHYGYTSQQSKIIGSGNFEELFNPPQRRWHDQILEQSHFGLEQTLQRFNEL